jgi:hypothetical protein
MRIPDSNGKNQIGQVSVTLQYPLHRLNVILAAWGAPEPVPLPLERPPRPCIKRGDVVLLKLIPEKSLDYESPPHTLDLSFFSRQTPTGREQQPPYRPAVVRRIILRENDATYFTLEVNPLMRRNGLARLSSRRSSCFVALETLIEATTVIQVPCDDIFVYKPFSLGVFKAEYDEVRLYI